MGVLVMGVYKRLARSKKGMSTIFGGLFFVILILMGFNLMLWNFIQYDAYNRSITSMALRDQQASSENLVVNNPGAVDFGAGTFNITVTNLGGSSVLISRIYINNLSPTGSTQCSTSSAISPCTVDSTPSTTSCVNGVSCYFTNGNIQVGELNHKIKVTGLAINDGSGYKVILSTTRGRLFSFYYPWPVTVPPSGGGQFVTNIGPLNIYFDYYSFNFTQNGSATSQPAWCVPTATSLLFWIKIANAATDSTVTLKKNTVIFPQPYSTSGTGGQFGPFYVVDSASTTPATMIRYDEVGNPYTLPAGTSSGPSASKIVKFGAATAAQADQRSLGASDFWLTFIGFNYIYRGVAQGQTIPFIAMRSVAGWPGACSS
ncbi:MAG TPA: hypothetical protein VFE98_02485 [Candidatus Bathyarchaeia archaeon]|nr:hypothetical protein [Candidatus Bathyarchaeia archaeon]